jgi:hypothetical protein
MEAISIIYGILLGVGSSIFYAVLGYIKEAVKSDEDFDYMKMTRTAIIGAILGVLIYGLGYDPKVAQDYAPVIFTVIGGNVIVEKIVRAIEYKLKQIEQK